MIIAVKNNINMTFSIKFCYFTSVKYSFTSVTYSAVIANWLSCMPNFFYLNLVFLEGTYVLALECSTDLWNWFLSVWLCEYAQLTHLGWRTFTFDSSKSVLSSQAYRMVQIYRSMCTRFVFLPPWGLEIWSLNKIHYAKLIDDCSSSASMSVSGQIKFQAR